MVDIIRKKQKSRYGAHELGVFAHVGLNLHRDPLCLLNGSEIIDRPAEGVYEAREAARLHQITWPRASVSSRSRTTK